ncbi:hypothetical protein [Clostridium tertium]|uniref:hypothetical protein n=1 Tax=Clostridium tertium TaxID=1559 RepID=UPI001C1DFF3C|nr:hypothetical protein [Clostridium tertium]MBU6137298.1 hypothetical protein [Clostridium tertium]
MKIKLFISRIFGRHKKQNYEDVKISNKYELIESINDYYVINFSISELKIKLIELESIYNNIVEPKDKAIQISLISLVLTITFNIFNYINTDINQKKVMHTNEIARYESIKNTYWMKALEVDREIKLTDDIDKKSQLEDYKNSLNQEIYIINEKLINENKNYREYNDLNILRIILKLLFWFIIFEFTFLIRNEVKWISKKRKKDELKIRIDVINNLIN